MPVKCKDIINIIEAFAPSYLASKWDNSGLLIGDGDQVIENVMVSLDISRDVINEAVNKGCRLIITHHPVIFSPLKSLNSRNYKEKMICDIISNNISVYSSHTCLDVADGGINDFLSNKLELINTDILEKSFDEKLYKICAYVPRGYEDKVREAMTSAGAGHIGNYSSCTFNINGTGTFLPLEGSEPFIGKAGTVENVNEVKIETIIDSIKLGKVIKSMMDAHPYEEPAYDIYPLHNKAREYGFGRVGYLKNPVLLKELCSRVKQMLGIDCLRVVGNLDKEIKKIALCSGSGGDFISNALQSGCDAYITGDIKYHDACDARDMGLALIDAGHFATEDIYMPQLCSYLKSQCISKKYDINIFLSSTNKDPIIKV